MRLTDFNSKGKKIAAYYGFDSQNALIVSSDDNGKYHIFMTYTIENLPVFNDYMTFDITSDGLMGFSGVWFTQNSLGEYRNAKSVADALLEFSASKDKPNGKIEISDITLGYNMSDVHFLYYYSNKISFFSNNSSFSRTSFSNFSTPKRSIATPRRSF